MPARYTRKAWADLINRGLASGEPNGGFLSRAESAQHDDCSSIIGEVFCDDLKNKSQEHMASLQGRATVDPQALIAMSAIGVLEGWEKVESAKLPTFTKRSHKRRADIVQDLPGAWSTRLFNRKGKLYIYEGLPPTGLKLSKVVQLAEDWLVAGPNFKPSLFINRAVREAIELINSSEMPLPSAKSKSQEKPCQIFKSLSNFLP